MREKAAGLFHGKGGNPAYKSQEEIDALYREIGNLPVERFFITWTLLLSRAQHQAMMEPNHPVSHRRQCQMLGISRSTAYYRPRPVSAEDLELMRLMGLHAVYPRPQTTKVNQDHHVYPYLLRGLDIHRPN